MIGQTVGTRYKILKHLGTGGFGQTYLAEDAYIPTTSRNSNLCVVKQLQPRSDDPFTLKVARRLFQTEAKTLHRLGDHSQIPRLLAHFEENQEFYIVQEFIEGYDLSSEILPNQQMEEPKVVSLLGEILEILTFVHNNRVIHRDLKPSNIMRRTQDGKLVLIDFGAVKQISTQIVNPQGQTLRTVAIGTPGYAPNELLGGQPSTCSDVYAVGIIAIQALTGLEPLDLPRDPKNAELTWRDWVAVSQEFGDILDQMVRYDFRERYEDAGQVSQVLQPLLPPGYPLCPFSYTLPVPLPPASPPASPQPDPISSNQVPPILSKSQPNGAIPVSTTIIPPPGSTQPPAFQTSTAATNAAQPNASPLPIPPTVGANSHQTVVQASPPSSTRQPVLKRYRPIALLIGTGVAVAGLAVGGWHYFNQLQLTAAIEAIADFKAKGQYDQCIRQAQNFPSANLQVQTLLGDCQIGQARQLAQQRKFKDAIVAVSGVAISLPARAEAEKLAIQWTQQILQLARDRYQQGKFTEAIALAQAVPKTSPIVEKVNNQVSQWQKEQQTYQPHLQAAQKALTEKKWQVAIAEAGKLPKTPPWQQQANLIIKQAQAEIDQAAVAAAQAAATAEPANVSPSGAYDTPLPAPEPTYDPPPAPTPAPPPVFAPPASSSGDGGNAPGGIPSDVIRNAPACGGGAC